MVSQELINDHSISPNCRLVLIALLSNKDDWNIHVAQLIKQYNGWFGRVKMYDLINEAIKAGYIKRDIYRVNNLNRCRYFLSETPKFKKCLRLSTFQDVEDRNAENHHDKQVLSKTKIISNKDYKESNSQNVHNSESSPPIRPKAAPPPDPSTPDPAPLKPALDSTGSTLFSQKVSTDYSSPEYVELLDLETEYIKHFRHNIVARWITKFGVTQVLKNIKYYLKIHGGKDKIDNPEAWMEKALKESFADIDKQAADNKRFAEGAKKAGQWKSLKINKRYCTELKLGVDISYNLPKENFETQLKRLYDRYKIKS